MGKALLRELFVLSTREMLARQPEGDLASGYGNYMGVLPWAICYSERFEGNPFYRDPTLLQALVRFGDFNCAAVDDKGNFSAGPFKGWDEWRMFAWMEAMKRIEGDLEQERVGRWSQKLVGAGSYVMDIATEMDTFDGLIPNHGIWGHAFLYRVGQLFGVREYVDMAALAFSRILGGQTPDGCFREGQSAALMPGTPVTGYNLTSASAVNMYYGFSGDPQAAQALEKAWHWLYDFLLPDGTMPPTLDHRQPYNPQPVGPSCAYFMNKPEGRWMARRALEAARKPFESAPADKRPRGAFGFHALQYDKVRGDVEEREPSWPEYTRMVAAEACVRRRHGWAAALSGMSNRYLSNFGLRLFAQERQDCVSIFHQKTGLIVGSAHSTIQEEFSTFVFYENGRAQYIPDDAYLKSTPPVDTMLLQYGSNVGAVSVDTTRPDCCEATFSLHGEKGKWPRRGLGHCLSAMAARAHLALRLERCRALRLKDRSWDAQRSDEEKLCLKVGPGEELDFGSWKVVSLDAPWEFRWPTCAYHPYALLQPCERVGILEVVLFAASVPSPDVAEKRPTATFRIIVP